jgi:glycosyltransferase involved in cell wall biosynthesis
LRVIAIIAAYNEERFIAGCLEHLFAHGVEAYLIDNSSTDRTVEIARGYLGRGLLDIETFPRSEGVYRWREILERKEELARTLDADWFMHVDPDEMHLPPRADQTLAEAFAEVEEAGCNVVDFQEFVFVPTRQSPDHDHPNYQETMRWYYPFTPSPGPRRMSAWQQQSGPIGLGNHGGHKLNWPGMKLYPEKFPMKHYLFLNARHILHKYGNRKFEKAEIERGWHGWRMRLEEESIVLPSQDELKTYTSGEELDPSNPRKQHVAESWAVSNRRWRANREGLSEYAVRWNWTDGPSGSGFTAVLRVKDEARSLPWVLPGVLRSVERVIVVDNDSTDGTADVARRVAAEAGLEDRLRVLSYPFAVSRCGPEHLRTFPDSVHSLTYFYNWSFSHVRTPYALKWDGDMVLTPQGERVLRDLAWQLQDLGAALTMRRDPVYVASDRVAYVDTMLGKAEPWGWPNSPAYTFAKAFDWELMLPRPGDPVIMLPDWACFELKWLDADEFSHWSHTDFKPEINARKRHEWELFHALREGSYLPEGVLRVESPDGTHVIEHLRGAYAPLRRERATSTTPSPNSSGG